MSALVVWMDSQHARLYPMDANSGSAGSALTHKEIRAHTGHEHDHDPFFKDLAHACQNSAEILVMGPGQAKDQFRHYLEKHHLPQILKNIVGTITVDHPTDNQILAEARKFFKTFDLVHHNI